MSQCSLCSREIGEGAEAVTVPDWALTGAPVCAECYAELLEIFAVAHDGAAFVFTAEE